MGWFKERKKIKANYDISLITLAGNVSPILLLLLLVRSDKELIFHLFWFSGFYFKALFKKFEKKERSCEE